MHKAKRTIGVMSFAFLAVSGMSQQAMAQGTQKAGATAPYPEMAPVDQYLMANRDDEIALARSAAPASVSRDATVLVLGRKGYETAIEGKNGFVCVVGRSWTGPFETKGLPPILVFLVGVGTWSDGTPADMHGH
ncbi:hypothetical protein QFZ41_001253 [Luteibacter sp. W1I16]|uniref:hypothetical protein n=1 Tax=Luteibacter sp. W1I16 TaxID=3373922 RepID=UPI003D1F205D